MSDKPEILKGTPVYSFKTSRLTDMINLLEGQAFGANLRLTTLGMGIDDLCIDINRGWTKIEGFRFEGRAECDLARKFADDFNAATAPVRQKFANDLRQLLANECLDLGSKALRGVEP